MRPFRFDPEDAGARLTAYASSNTRFFALARSIGEAQLTCLRLGPGGCVGRHPAPVPQLFAVVAGDGRVKTPEGEEQISSGEAVFWEAGEEHETVAGEHGMTVFVLEAPSLTRAP